MERRSRRTAAAALTFASATATPPVITVRAVRPLSTVRAAVALIMILAVLPLSIAPAVWAQDENEPEVMAAIKEGEVGRLDRDSVRDFGQQMRFEVSIRWGDSGGPKPEGHMTRNVRYVADCKAGTLLLVSVAVIDGSGSRVKTMLSPPGAADPVAPSAGSLQARWLKDVCRA